MNAEAYLADPCGASSLPFWKTGRIAVPEQTRIVRDDAYDAAAYAAWRDERFFKLRRALTDVKIPALPDGYRLADIGAAEYARHIGACYEKESVTAAELDGYRTHPVYDPALWVALATEGGEIAATGIAELDARIGEGVLEWIQVSPAHRRKGLGAFVVNELLWRMKARAAFATVSGRLDNRTNPLALYEACGFGDKVVWHILTKQGDDA